MNRDPATAPKRADLPFLRRRARPRAPAAVSDYFAGRAEHPRHAPPVQTAPAPAPAPPTPAAVTGSSALDLDDARVAPRTPPTPAAPSAPAGRAARPVGPGERVAPAARVAAHEQQLLTVRNPAVTLTRLQSGIGTLTLEAVTSVPGLRLGCAYQLATGVSSTVQLAGGNRFAPPGSRRPVVMAQREQYEQLAVDLRQVRTLERLAVYVFSEDGSELDWAGTLVASTFGGGRVELALDTLYRGAVAVPMSIVNAGGELWLRAEMETIAGPIRDACRAYGFDRITWKDERTPAD